MSALGVALISGLLGALVGYGVVTLVMKRLFRTSPRRARHMCIRCDEIREDVPFRGGRCPECQRVVDAIAAAYPGVYAEYLRRSAHADRIKNDVET